MTGCQNGRMSKSADEGELLANDASGVDSEEAMIARITANQSEGQDTTEDVRAILKLAAKINLAEVDRLAK
jgi:hypothetical protein